MTVVLSVCLPVSLSVWLSVCLCVCRSGCSLSVCLFVHLPVCLCVCRSVCQSVGLAVSVCLCSLSLRLVASYACSRCHALSLYRCSLSSAAAIMYEHWRAAWVRYKKRRVKLGRDRWPCIPLRRARILRDRLDEAIRAFLGAGGSPEQLQASIEAAPPCNFSPWGDGLYEPPMPPA